MPADYELSSNLNDSPVLAGIQRIEQRFDNLEKRGNKAFNDVGKGAKTSGLQIGAVAGVVQELVGRLIDLGEAGVRAFADIIAKGVELNKQAEVSERVFTNLFGDPKLGKATVEFLEEVSQKLRVNQGEALTFAQSILPSTDSLEQFQEILRLVDIQSDATGKSIQELTFPVREALSGDLTSLIDQFDLPRSVREDFKVLAADIGEAGALVKILNDNFDDFGKQDISGTLNTDIKEISGEFTALQKILGEPIFEQLKEDAAAFLDILDEKGPGLEQIVDAIGRLVAEALKLASSDALNFADGLDTEKILNFIEEVDRTLNYLKATADIIGGINSPLAVFFDTLEDGTPKTANFLDTLVDGRSKIEVFNDGIRASLQIVALLNALLTGAAVGLADVWQNLDDVIARRKTLEEVFQDSGVPAREAMRNVLNNAAESLNQADQSTADFQQGTDDFKAEQAEGTDPSLRDEINAQLAAKAAEATKETEELTAAREKLNKAYEEFDIDKSRAELEEQLRIERDLIDQQIENAEKREGIARKNAEKISDIYRKHYQDIEDAARDLSRKEEDIARDQARQLEDLDTDIAKERIQIEEDYHRTVQQIRNRFNLDAQEAIRANDAIAFLAAKRRADAELEEAENSRNQQTEDATQSAEERRSELNTQLQREIEDAKIANQRKLEDLRISLEQDLEAQRIAYARDLQEQTLHEQRKTEEMRREQERRREDFNRDWANRLADLQRNLQKELDLIAAAEQKKSAIRAAARAQIRHDAETVKRGDEDEEGRTQEGTIRTGQGVRAQQRHSGGPVQAGQPYTVKPDEEVFQFASSGRVIPLNRLMLGGQTSSTVSNVTNNTTNLNLEAMMRYLSPSQMAQVQQLVLALHMESYR